MGTTMEYNTVFKINFQNKVKGHTRVPISYILHHQHSKYTGDRELIVLAYKMFYK